MGGYVGDFQLDLLHGNIRPSRAGLNGDRPFCHMDFSSDERLFGLPDGNIQVEVLTDPAGDAILDGAHVSCGKSPPAGEVQIFAKTVRSITQAKRGATLEYQVF